MTDLPINQKEYLKKYLGIGKAPGEKKKKKKKQTVSRITIIDDDVESSITNKAIQEDLTVDEDAPQIVAIIDERPPSLRIDEKTQNPLWQPVGTVDNIKQEDQKQMIKSFKIQSKTNDKPLFDHSPPRNKKPKKSEENKREKEIETSLDIVIKEERRSPLRDDDISPPRKSISSMSDSSPPRRRDNDISPARKKRSRFTKKDSSSPRRERSSDQSPPRRRKDNDQSPPRKRRNSDQSPPRRRKDSDRSPSRKRRNSDQSPPRRRKNNDQSPPRKSKHSPSRRNIETSRSHSKYEKDNSPKRNRNYKDRSPPRASREEDKSRSLSKTEDYSPPRKTRKENKEETNKKMDKTLDGKKAGIQSAKDLITETKTFKSREDKLFKSLSQDASGQNAETVFRDRQTGKIRNIEEEEERKRKKQEEEERNKEKYERWGRGLAQVESREEQLKNQLHEMSKPLARYADDEDLEKYLKEQEREGDPMLAYIRKKKRKKAAEAGEITKPQFEGEFMPNRYGIRPGHRWDGVDRSNGYEKKWFEVQNEKKALQEDSYKWSTEDM